MIQAISSGEKTGHLTVYLTQDHGAIVFDQGRVVHAQFGMHTGEKAFAKLVMAARRDPGSHFCFSRLDRLPTDLPTTIQSDCSIWSDFLLPLMR